MFDVSVGKKPVPTIACSRTSTGGSIGGEAVRDEMVEREAVEREGEQGRVADEVAEARAGDARGALHLEAAELGVLLRLGERGRLAPAGDLDASSSVSPSGADSCGGFGTCGSSASRSASAAASASSAAQLLLHPLELLDLLGRRLALQLRPAAQLVDAGDERAPALVRSEQRVERLGGALPGERGVESRPGRCARP